MREVVILSAVRTPIGKFNGAFKDTSAVELGRASVVAAITEANITADDVEQVIFGNVLQAGNGQNPARQIAVKAGIPVTSTGMTINEVCGSGLKAVILGQQAIQLGVADTIVVGGTENMSQAPYLYERSANIEDFEPAHLLDSMMSEGLTDAFSQLPMGTTAESVAEKYQITRQAQDEFADSSQQKASRAQNAGAFDKEIVPVPLPDGSILASDQGIRPDSSVEKLSTLKTIFQADGSVTAGNSSSINDGAAALVLMAKDVAEARGLSYMATLGEYCEVGNEPDYMGYAPYYAIKNLLTKLDKTVFDIDSYEINEAFASQSIAVARDLNLPLERVNPNGGAIALGHPLGASGARILVTLVHNLQRHHLKEGIASLCVGGGIGLALEVSAEV